MRVGAEECPDGDTTDWAPTGHRYYGERRIRLKNLGGVDPAQAEQSVRRRGKFTCVENVCLRSGAVINVSASRG